VGHSQIESLLSAARDHIQIGEYERAWQQLDSLHQQIERGDELPTWRARDAEVVLYKLERRIELVEQGFIGFME
jgi:hypothetical protein